MRDRCDTAYTRLTAPGGLGLASRFPWWRTGYVATNGNVLYEKLTFAGRGGQQLFINQNPWPVYIDELRFWATENLGGTDATILPTSLMERTAFKIKTDLLGEIVHNWMPGSTYNTENDRHLVGPQNGMVFTLPANYYLQRGDAFSVNLYTPDAYWKSKYFQLGLRGCDPTNQTPIVILSKILQVPDSAASPAPGPLVVTFDDGRDESIRDMWVRDFVIASKENASAAGTYTKPAWERVWAHFYPSQGPQWSDDIWTPLGALSDQVQSHPASGIYNAPVIHRPKSPYVLLPGHSLTVEAQVRFDLTHDEEFPDTVWIWAHARGYQEGKNA
jgi:hypothetical protein